MKLISLGNQDQSSLGALVEGGVVDLTNASTAFASLRNVDDLCSALETDPSLLKRLDAACASTSPRWPTGEIVITAPLRRPGKILCVGLNYRDHCRETGTAFPERPVIFAKFASAIVGPNQPIRFDRRLTKEVDWEVELAVVIGRETGPRRQLGLDAVLGYTVANDISARDLQRDEGQWVRAKSLDTFCPLGPAVVTADEVGTPQKLALGCTVNGLPQQRSNTSEMIFTVADLVTHISAGITLRPGDIILTGTPHGIGAFQDPPQCLADGDLIDTWVAGLGHVENTVVAPWNTGPDRQEESACSSHTPNAITTTTQATI
jgi:5-carboxymethyl-2-hydroxymuconate isomerase